MEPITNNPPEGEVVILGNAIVGETLTADISAVTDADGITDGTQTYQWYVDGVMIDGATMATFDVTENEVGGAITVEFGYTDDAGNMETVPSAPTAAVMAPMPPMNNLPEGEVVILGDAIVGETLTADISAVTDADGITDGTQTYQWYVDGVMIDGATMATFDVTENEVGGTITVEFGYTDDAGNMEVVPSQPTAAVMAPMEPMNNLPEGEVVILGDALVGETLTADISAVTDADMIVDGTQAYQWYVDGVMVDGATMATFEVTEAHVDGVITVDFTYTDGAGNMEGVTSAATAAVPAPVVETPVNNPPEGPMVILGDALVGETLVARPNSIMDADGIEDGTQAFQWYIDGVAIEGATMQQFMVTEEHIGGEISVEFTYTDGAGNMESVFSPAEPAVPGAGMEMPVEETPVEENGPTDAPGIGQLVLTGIALVGGNVGVRFLNAETETLESTAFEFQWFADGVAIEGETGARLDVTEAFIGAELTVEATYTIDGNTFTIVSPMSDEIPDPATDTGNNMPEGPMIILGDALVGETLIARPNSIRDPDGVQEGTQEFQWFLNGEPIEGATDRSYQVTTDDEGGRISVSFTYTDLRGNVETVVSEEESVEALTPITGTDDADTIVVFADKAAIDGGAGEDRVEFSGNQNDFTLQITADGLILTDRSSETGRVYTLDNVEALDFDVDLDVFGDAMDLSLYTQTAMLTNEQLEGLTELYIAYLGRAPDAVGLGFWASRVAEGMSKEEISELFTTQPEFMNIYGGEVTNEAFIDTVYQNILGRDADDAGFNFWLEALDSGAVSKPQFIAEFLDGARATPVDGGSVEFITQQSADAAFLSAKTDLSLVYSAELGMSNVDNALQLLANFDGSAESYDAALLQITEFFEDASAAVGGEFLMPLVGTSEAADMIMDSMAIV